MIGNLDTMFESAAEVTPDGFSLFKFGKKKKFEPETDLDLNNLQKVCVLDMDETLIHKSTFPPHDSIEAITIGIENCFIFKRPGLDEFIARVTELYDTYIYTAGAKFYASQVLDQICPMIPEDHRFYREHCNNKEGKPTKDLKLLNRPFSHVIMVDDNGGMKKYYPDNTLNVPIWNGSPKDKYLLETALPILEQCAISADVRPILAKTPQQKRIRSIYV